MSEVLLDVKGLKKYFPTKRGMLHAVDDVNLTINKGETLGIVGESGCGKSTLGRVILRLHEATSGDVLYDGMDINNFSADEMRKMRQMTQEKLSGSKITRNMLSQIENGIATPSIETLEYIANTLLEKETMEAKEFNDIINAETHCKELENSAADDVETPKTDDSVVDSE